MTESIYCSRSSGDDVAAYAFINNAIALAHRGFQTSAVQDLDRTSIVADQAFLLEASRNHGDAGARSANHVGEEFLCERKSV